MFWKAVKTSAILSVLFMLVYNACNWFTSLRGDVGTWFYEWERLIPFIPIFIIPYMLIDVFFVAAPFLCKTDEELKLYSQRTALAIVIAGIFFLAMPLRLAWDRPHVEGWLGAIFNPFCAMDKPFNLLPSLHITLRTILADLYGRHTRGAVRWVSHIWFSLIGFSTVFTHQHHIVDVIGGFLLAGFCFYIVRPAPIRMPVIPNHRVGLKYGAGAVIALFLAILLRPWGLWLLWPAISLGLVAAGYFRLGPGVYGKHNGRLPLASALMMGQVLIGQHLSLTYYKRQARRWDELTPNVWIGRKLSDAEAQEAIDAGVTAVVDMTGEFSEARPFLNIHYLNLPVLDLTAPTKDQIRAATEFIAKHSANGIVYIHCKIGYSRTAAIAGAWLLHDRKYAKTPTEAIALMRAKRPSIVIRPEAETVLNRE